MMDLGEYHDHQSKQQFSNDFHHHLNCCHGSHIQQPDHQSIQRHALMLERLWRIKEPFRAWAKILYTVTTDMLSGSSFDF